MERARRLIPGLWAGVLLCIALMATPAPFAILASHEAGRVVARIFSQEAYLSLALGVAVLLLERASTGSPAQGGSRFSTPIILALTAIFCTVFGYFGLQPMLEGARAGQGSWTFGQLHAVSLVFFAGKILAVAALAWRACGLPISSAGPSS